MYLVRHAGALTPPFPRKGLAPNPLLCTATLQVAYSDAIP